MNKRDFVVISGDEYSFYQGNRRIVTVKTNNMTAEWLEKYRTRHDLLFRDMVEPEEPQLA